MKDIIKKYSNLLKGIFSFILFFSTSYIQQILIVVFNIKKIDYCYNQGYIAAIENMPKIKEMLRN